MGFLAKILLMLQIIPLSNSIKCQQISALLNCVKNRLQPQLQQSHYNSEALAELFSRFYYGLLDKGKLREQYTDYLFSVIQIQHGLVFCVCFISFCVLNHAFFFFFFLIGCTVVQSSNPQLMDMGLVSNLLLFQIVYFCHCAFGWRCTFCLI